MSSMNIDKSRRFKIITIINIYSLKYLQIQDMETIDMIDKGMGHLSIELKSQHLKMIQIYYDQIIYKALPESLTLV